MLKKDVLDFDITITIRRDPDALTPAKVQLLATIDATGSLSDAVREMGICYSHGWKLVRELNSQVRRPLVTFPEGELLEAPPQ